MNDTTTSGRPSLLTAAVFCIMLMLGTAILLSYKACGRAMSIAEKFQTQNITRTFRSNLEQVTSTHGNILELATCDTDELFRQKDERKLGWFYLGTTEAEINARCTFRYHVQLSDAWVLDVRSNVCMVHAPQFRPSLPVAIHTDNMEKRAESGWARFDKHDMINGLEESMTPDLARRAVDAQHIVYVREQCRRSVAEFVKNWLLREDHWRKDRFTAIIVQFPDETGQTDSPWTSDAKPVIQLTQ